MTVEFDPVLVSAFALAMVRATAWLFVSPPFNTRMIPLPVKGGIAAALSLAAAPMIADAGLPLATGPFFGSILLQVVVGLAMGLLTLFLVSAVQAAGSLVDLFAGYSMAAIYDPTSDAQTSIFGRFYQLIAITLLFATNAHLVLVNGFYRSFEAIPADGIVAADVASLLTDTLGQLMVAAIEVAGPVLACLFLTELTLGLLTRAAPTLNVFALAFPLRVIVALVVVGVALPLLAPAMGNLVDAAVSPFGG